jgi:hypothetical protein
MSKTTRAIYDALDQHQYKAALLQCNKSLKKTNDPGQVLLIKALKALAWERMNPTPLRSSTQTNEAMDLVMSALFIEKGSVINPAVIVDDTIAQTLMLTLKAQGRRKFRY